MKTDKTLRDLVTDILYTLQLANDRMGALRDAVDSENEKQIFNKSRELLQTELLPKWRHYRDNLPDKVGNKSMGKGWTGHCKNPSDD